MTTTVETIEHDLAEYGPPFLTALGVAGALLGGGPFLASGVAAAKVALTTLLAGIDAKADPAAIAADLAKLPTMLAKNDAAADAAVARKWPEVAAVPGGTALPVKPLAEPTTFAGGSVLPGGTVGKP